MKIKFEGFVQELTDEIAVCRFVSEEEEDEYIMEVPLKEFGDDAKDLKEGSILTYECSYTIEVCKEKWTEEEIEEAKRKGKELSEWFKGK